MSERMFPLLQSRGSALAPGTTLKNVPWALLEPHAKQAFKNHGQTLERLAERQGLSASEALAVIQGREWSDIPDGNAEPALAKLVAEFLGQY